MQIYLSFILVKCSTERNATPPPTLYFYLLSLSFTLQEMLGSLVIHTDVLRKAGMKVSAQAEQHGCFQQVC